MSKKTVWSRLAVTCVVVTLIGTRARADILDDIWAVVQQARDRATQARDRATEARNRAVEARDAAREVRDEVRQALESMTASVRGFISEAVQDLQREIDDELQGRAEFLGDNGCSPACDQFRADLVLLLTNFESISNSLLAIAGITDLTVDYGREIDLIQQLPGRVLFPLHRMLVVETNLLGSGLMDRLTRTAADLVVVAEFTAVESQARAEDDPNADARALLDAQLAANDWALKRIARLQNIGTGLAGTGVALKITGKIFQAKGETTFSGEAQAHGYVGGSIQNNRRKKIGQFVEGIGDALLAISGYLTNKTQYSVLISTQKLILTTLEANQQKILDNQDKILKALNACGLPAGPIGTPVPPLCGATSLALLPMSLLGLVAFRAARSHRARRRRRESSSL